MTIEVLGACRAGTNQMSQIWQADGKIMPVCDCRGETKRPVHVIHEVSSFKFVVLL
jgi:hypothetical protein